MVIRINSNTINISIDTAVMDISIRVNITISNHCDYCFSLGVPAFHDHLDHDHAHRYQCDQHYALLIMINTMSINFMNRSGMPVLLCSVLLLPTTTRLRPDYERRLTQPKWLPNETTASDCMHVAHSVLKMKRKLFLRLFRHYKCFQFMFHDSTKGDRLPNILPWIEYSENKQPPTFVHCNSCCLSLHIFSSSSLNNWLRYLNPITKPNIPIMALTVLIECCGNTTQDSWVKSRAHRKNLRKDIWYAFEALGILH